MVELTIPVRGFFVSVLAGKGGVIFEVWLAGSGGGFSGKASDCPLFPTRSEPVFKNSEARIERFFSSESEGVEVAIGLL